MVSVHDLERASTLAREAVELVDAGHKEVRQLLISATSQTSRS